MGAGWQVRSWEWGGIPAVTVEKDISAKLLEEYVGRHVNTTLPGSGPPEGTETAFPLPRWRWWTHLLLLAAYPLLIGILGWAQGSGNAPALGSSVRGLLVVSAIQLITFGAVFVAACVFSHPGTELLLLKWRTHWTLPLGLGYSVALRLMLGLIAIAVFSGLIALRFATPEQFQDFVSANRPDVAAIIDTRAMARNPAYYVLTLTVVSFIVAGLREELWRSGFIAGLRRLWPGAFETQPGQYAAVALGAVVFGIGHAAQGPVAVWGTTLLGLGLGSIMILHRSIWPAVLAHGFFDATSFALLPWAMEHIRGM